MSVHSADDRLNTKTWIVWFLSALLVTFVTQNPFYLSIILLITVVVFSAFKFYSEDKQVWGTFLKVGLFLAVFSVVYNVLTSHSGGTVFLKLPSSLPVIGENLTWEAAVFGAVFGGFFFTMVSLFALFNVLVDRADFLRLVPRFMRKIGLVCTVAVVFVPQAVAAAREIKEAQVLRGVKFSDTGLVSGFRSVATLSFPLLITGLEKALTVAESMESRGYGKSDNAANSAQKLLLVFSLAGLLAGIFLLFWQIRLGYVIVATSLALTLLALFLVSVGIKVTRYRQDIWRSSDTLVTVTSLVAASSVLAIKLFSPGVLSYNPYPKLALPDFNPLIGLLLLLLVIPVVKEL